jgi:hypothetical protein
MARGVKNNAKIKARGGKKNAARLTRSGAVIGSSKPAAAKTAPARRLPATDEDKAARAAAMARLAEKTKLLEAELKAALGPGSKQTSAAAKAAAAATNARERPTLLAGNNDSSDT